MKPDESIIEALWRISLEAVDAQLEDNELPETRKTLERLEREGFSTKDVKSLIASVIAVESFLALKRDEEFNDDRFARNLNKLPSQDFDEK